MSRFTTLALCAAACLSTPSLLPGQAASWVVDSARAPERLLEFTATEGTWMSVDISPDGRTLVFDLLGHLYEMPYGGGAARALTRGRSWNHFPRYSPDGQSILFTSDRSGMEQVWRLWRANDSLEQVTRGTDPTFQAVPAPDGRHFYATSMDLGARFSGARYDLHGTRTQLINPVLFSPPTRFNEDTARGVVWFGQPAGPLYQAGFELRAYDLRTGQVRTHVRRPGGAADPAMSRDGRWLAYVHRQDKETQLVLHDLSTGRERVLIGGLDRDRQEGGAGTTYGAYPTYAWHPNNQEILIAFGGKLRAVSVASGSAREIPFQAPVRREIAQRIMFPVTIPASGQAMTRSHRFGVPVDGGVIYEALGDLWWRDGDRTIALTSTPDHESSPAFHARTRTVYYATWSDDSLGAVWSRPLEGRRAPIRLTSVPAQYGSVTVSPDGRQVAVLRGRSGIQRGESLEGQGIFDLVLLDSTRAERVVTAVQWSEGQFANFATKHPPAITWGADGRSLYFTEFAGDTLFLKRVRTDGLDETTLMRFPHAVRVSLSPDLRWVLVREYTRSYVAPFDFAGRVNAVSPFDRQGASFRVDSLDGDYFGWTEDSREVYWTRGDRFFRKGVDDIVARRGAPRTIPLGIQYAVAAPNGTIALTNARVITMDGQRRVLDRATVIVEGSRIVAVGQNVPVPAGARVFDLAGRTVMPGIIDAHAHYNPDVSALNVVEQRHQGLLANLAYGVTTMYEVYGNGHKDFLVSDLQRAGRIDGARLLSTSHPIYGLRYYRSKLFRPIQSLADAREVVQLNKDQGATALKDYVHFNRSSRQQMYQAARELGVNVVSETAADPQMNWTMLIDGVSGLEHSVGLTPLYDDIVRLWGASGVGNTPTLVVVYNGPAGDLSFHQTERLWEDPKLRRFFPEDALLGFRRPTRFFDDDVYAVDMASELRKLHAAGVSLQISGHGQMHGLDKHWEMELFARGGFTPMEILGFATIQSARYLGLEAQLGSIEVGKLADLVVLTANPLDDIRNSRQIEYVMQNGVVYHGADASRVWPNPRPRGRFYYMPEDAR